MSITVVGSVARRDFVEGGSDLDIMYVHTHHGMSSGEIGSLSPVRALLDELFNPVIRLYRPTGRQKPWMVDLHFVDYELLREQPQWADPANFRQEYVERNTYLWLYAFDLQANSICLSGADPRRFIKVHPPDHYALWAARKHAATLTLLRNDAGSGPPTDDAVQRWKILAGGVLQLAALAYGSRSLRKREVYNDFQTRVPNFRNKTFARVLWHEYLHGGQISLAQRTEWAEQCMGFCRCALELIIQAHS